GRRAQPLDQWAKSRNRMFLIGQKVRNLHGCSELGRAAGDTFTEADRRGAKGRDHLVFDAMRGAKVKFLARLVVLVDQPAVGVRELDGACDDGVQQRIESERRAYRLADLAQRCELFHGLRQLTSPRLEL